MSLPEYPEGSPHIHDWISYRLSLFQDMTAYGWLQGALHDQVNLYIQKFAEIALKPNKLKKGRHAVKLHKHIQIATFALFPSQVGTEEGKFTHSITLTQLRQVCL